MTSFIIYLWAALGCRLMRGNMGREDRKQETALALLWPFVVVTMLACYKKPRRLARAENKAIQGIKDLSKRIQDLMPSTKTTGTDPEEQKEPEVPWRS